MRARTSAIVRALFFAVTAALLGACSTVRTKPTVDAAARAVIEQYFAALNKRDLLALTAYVTPDFQWVSMVKGERIVEVDSREALVAVLRRHFEQYEHYRWRIDGFHAVGNVLAVTERSEWREGTASQARTTLGVYELFDGRILRVTYYLAD